MTSPRTLPLVAINQTSSNTQVCVVYTHLTGRLHNGYNDLAVNT